MGTVCRDIQRFDLTPVYTHPDAQADIILLHGLNGQPARTWKAKESDFYWPIDLLPDTLGPDAHANILVYGYNADVTSAKGSSPSENYMYEHAETLVASLTSYRSREGTSTRPIIWVVHSLGGILLKRALNYSNDLKDKNHEPHRSVFVSTYGIIFLGTPHHGSSLASWGTTLQNMANATMPKKLFNTEGVLVKTLKKDSETLRDIGNHFLDIYQRFQIHMAHENHKTDFILTKRLVVDSASANPKLPGVNYYGIEATHSGMCKFDGPTSPGYRIVSTAIHDWVLQAPKAIARRWDIEKDEQRQRAMQEATERLGPMAAGFPGYNSPMTLSGYLEGPSAPPRGDTSAGLPTLQRSHSIPSSLFIHPNHFRPNTVFVGRDKEMADLHTLLLDQERRSMGTSAVVVKGMSGIGKSALSRQYVFNHKDHYPGGIYWIRASTPQEMEDGYWQIARNDAIKQMIGHKTEIDLQDPKKMVDVVRSWFNRLEGWLIIFDGIRFDDPTAIGQFVPDNKNTSLIFTSTERPIASSHLFDHPTILELGLLPVPEAQALLLEEMGKRQPYTPDDLKMALELVQLMDRLPLMIHSAAQQMKVTGEPLAKYLQAFKAKPSIGDAALPAFQSIRDDLQDRGETAALNLISILSFFSQIIPVEMLVLGLKALDSRTPVKSHKGLNKTFATLIAFALVERSETADAPSMSSKTSDNSGEVSAEPLDTLWIHNVIQLFFINVVAEDRQFWLERAIAVFCHSFDEADSRMKESTRPDENNDSKTDLGLPDDYRRYSVHGKRLLEHVDRNKRTKLSPELGAARSELVARLKRIPAEVDRLQRVVSTCIVTGHDAPRISVFQRSNSWSTPSTSTAPTLSQTTSSLSSASLDGRGRIPKNALYRLPVEHTNPHDFHVPYPVPSASVPFPYENTIPALPYHDEHPDDRTVTPFSEPEVQGQSQWHDGGVSEDAGVRQHRAVKRLGERRYRDRAGAWRDSTVNNDPRVSISRESVRGLFSTSENPSSIRLPSHVRVLSESQAEAGLRSIKKASPPPNRGGRIIQDHTRSPVLGASRMAPPGLKPRPENRSEPVSGSAIDEAGQPSSRVVRSRSPLSPQIGGHSSRFTPPHGTPLRLTDAPPQPPWVNDGQPQPYNPYVPKSSSDLWEDLMEWDARVGSAAPPTQQGALRTSNSSPGTQQNPFPPPGLPISTNQHSSLQRNYYTERADAGFSTQPHEDWAGTETWSHSAPLAHHPAVLVSPPAQGTQNPLVSHPVTGYTSQPMSRNPSSVPREPMPITRGRSTSRGREFTRRVRPASIVETEPSPRLPAFGIGLTSYQVWEQEHDHRPRARGDSLLSSPSAPRWFPRPGTRTDGSGSGSRSGSRTPSRSVESSLGDGAGVGVAAGEPKLRSRRSGPGGAGMEGRLRESYREGGDVTSEAENTGLGIRWEH